MPERHRKNIKLSKSGRSDPVFPAFAGLVDVPSLFGGQIIYRDFLNPVYCRFASLGSGFVLFLQYLIIPNPLWRTSPRTRNSPKFLGIDHKSLSLNDVWKMNKFRRNLRNRTGHLVFGKSHPSLGYIDYHKSVSYNDLRQIASMAKDQSLDWGL